MENMKNMFNINDISGQNGECCAYANQFLPYAHKKLGFNKPVGVNFISDPENAKDPLGKTAYYDPNKMEITIFVDKRHVKDILRSLSHELVHHSQNCRGEFDQGIETGKGYAQKDPHMRKMEAEAYLLGNGFLFRDWEDHLKEKKQMSNFNETKLRKYVNNLVRTVLKEDQGPGGTGPDMPKDPDAQPGPGDGEGEIEGPIMSEGPGPEFPAPRDEKSCKDEGGTWKVKPGTDAMECVGYLDPTAGPGQGPVKEASEKEMQKFIKEPPPKSKAAVKGADPTKGTHQSRKAAWMAKHRALVKKKKEAKDQKAREEIDAQIAALKKKMGLDEPDPKSPEVPSVAGAAERKAAALEKHRGGQASKTATGPNENWLKGNKDQLLFEELVKKWTK